MNLHKKSQVLVTNLNPSLSSLISVIIRSELHEEGKRKNIRAIGATLKDLELSKFEQINIGFSILGITFSKSEENKRKVKNMILST